MSGTDNSAQLAASADSAPYNLRLLCQMPLTMLRSLTLLFAAFVALPAIAGPAEDIVAAARAQIGVITRYDSNYQRIAYPGGDILIDRGVCTDVASRKVGLEVYRHKYRSSAGPKPGYVFSPAWDFDCANQSSYGLPSW